MHVIVVAQNKGGEGKTTLSRLLIDYLGRKGLRTLGIDMDPQCNLSQRFLAMDMDPSSPDGVLPPVHPEFDPEDTKWDGRSSVNDIYRSRSDLGVWPYATKYENVQIIPGNGKAMRDLEMVRKDEVKELIHDRMQNFLSEEDVQAAFDVVVIDTAPSKSPLTISAIRAATHIVIPCQMEQMSIEGLLGMIQLWRQENRSRTTKIEMIGIMPNKFRHVALHRANLEKLQENPGISPYLTPVKLGLRTAFAEADEVEAKPRTVFDLSPSNDARQDATNVCEYILERAGIARELVARSA